MAPQASSRMLKKAVQQGRIKRRGDAYSVRYGEPLREVRTMLADFFSILLEVRSSTSHHQQIGCCTSNGVNSEKVPGTAQFQLSFPQTQDA
jgi:hypothetical protein